MDQSSQLKGTLNGLLACNVGHNCGATRYKTKKNHSGAWGLVQWMSHCVIQLKGESKLDFWLGSGLDQSGYNILIIYLLS